MTHIYPMGKLKIGDFEMNTHSQKSSNHFFFANHFLSYQMMELVSLIYMLLHSDAQETYFYTITR